MAIEVIQLCDVLLCFEDAVSPLPNEDGYHFCPQHAAWYAEYVAAGRPRDVRRWLKEAHPEAVEAEAGWRKTRDGE